MTTQLRKFRKRPVVVDAFQLPGLFDDDVTAFHRWAAQVGFTDYTSERNGSLAIETLEGTMIAGPGDWIIKGVKGEFYPCKQEIFAATYEAVEDTPSTPWPGSNPNKRNVDAKEERDRISGLRDLKKD